MTGVFTTDSQGLRIATEVRGSGPPIVFAHGLTGNRSGVIAQFEPFLAEYSIVAFDQRGHAESTPVHDSNLYDPRLMADDLRAVMDACRIERAVVGGESMGAATALLFALAHPERTTALLLTVPAFGSRPNPDRETIRQMGDLIEKGGVEAYLEYSRTANRYNLPDDVRATIRERLLRHDERSLATACKTVIDWVVLPDLSKLADIRVPACIVGWRGDPLHPFDLAEEMAAAIPGATLAERTIAEHFADPAGTGRVYVDFLRSLR